MDFDINYFINADGFQQLLAFIQEAVVLTDRDYVITYWNDMAARITGWTPAEAIGRNYLELLPYELSGSSAEADFAGLLEVGHFIGHAVYARKDGQPFSAATHVGIIRDANGEVMGFIATFRDLTERLLHERVLEESERRYRDLVLYAPVGIYEIDFRASRFLSMNDAACQLMGYSREEILAMNPLDIFSEESQTRYQARAAEWLQGRKPAEEVEYELVARDGREIYVLINVRFTTDDKGEPTGATGIIRDITERKLAEIALRETEYRYNLAVSVGQLGIFDSNLTTGEVYWNDNYVRMLGYKPGDVQPSLEFMIQQLHPDDRSRIKAEVARNKAKGGAYTSEWKLLWPDGTVHWLKTHGYAGLDNRGRPKRIFGLALDVTEVKLAEQVLRENEQNLEAMVRARTLELEKANRRISDILDSIKDVFFTLDEEWRFTYVNQAASDLVAIDPCRRSRPNIWKLFPEDVGTLFWDQLHEVMQKRIPVSFECETQYIRYPWAHFSVYPLGRGISVLCRDITGRKQGEQELRETKECLGRVFVYSPVIMAIGTVENGVYVDVNQAWERAFGLNREEVIGRCEGELNLWTDTSMLQGRYPELVREKHLYNYEIKYRGASGEERIGLCQTDTIPIGTDEYYLHTMVDVTEQKKLEREMARLDRLNLIGEMAASIGHEIRNPMTSVRGFLQILGSKEEYQDDKAYFDLMIEELDRANAIITEYLSMARNKNINRRKQSLDLIISAIYPIIQSTANHLEMRIRLELNNPPDILADEGEIKQLILNIAHNGLEAMQPKGSLTIATRQENHEVVLSISDEGTGISPVVQTKMDVPFFTTKDYGTGLGLPICYSIAARHQARIDFATGPAGTTFYVRFPEAPGDGPHLPS